MTEAEYKALRLALREAHRQRECAHADAVAAIARLRAAIWAELCIEADEAMAYNDLAAANGRPFANLDDVHEGGGSLLRRCNAAQEALEGENVWETSLEEVGAYQNRGKEDEA